MLPLFSLIHIQYSTFHQADRCSSLQTVRWFRRSDRKPVRLPFRLKELRTFACFSFASFRILVFHKETFHSLPSKSTDRRFCRPEPKACRAMSPGSYQPANPFWVRTDSKQSLQPYGQLIRHTKRSPDKLLSELLFSALLILR